MQERLRGTTGRFLERYRTSTGSRLFGNVALDGRRCVSGALCFGHQVDSRAQMDIERSSHSWRSKLCIQSVITMTALALEWQHSPVGLITTVASGTKANKIMPIRSCSLRLIKTHSRLPWSNRRSGVSGRMHSIVAMCRNRRIQACRDHTGDTQNWRRCSRREFPRSQQANVGLVVSSVPCVYTRTRCYE